MSDAEWQRKCQPNRAGKYPCLDCLKKGMRYFHEVCDPVKREANFGRHKTRQKEGGDNSRTRAPKPFPPKGKDRNYPIGEYDNRACKNCIREDVKPGRACQHPEHICFRREGGECDKAGATTRRERAQVVAKLRNQKLQRYKSTSLAVRVHRTTDDVRESPRQARADDRGEASAEPTKTTLAVTKRSSEHPDTAEGKPPAKNHKAKTGKVARTKVFSFHEHARDKPFSPREMEFALRTPSPTQKVKTNRTRLLQNRV